MVDKTQTARSAEDTQALVRNLEQLSTELKVANDKTETVAATKNETQKALSKLDNTETTISPAYVQAEIEQLTADIKIVADKVDAIIASLQSANILK
jgi:seryl-tRNA synthetase